MTTLADIKNELDGLQTDEQKLEAFAVSSQASLADLQTQLAAAIAAAAAAGQDPAALDAIAAQITTMQAGVAAAIPAAPPAA